MINVRLQIEDGPIKDTQDYGLVYLDSDKRVGAETVGFEATSYPEEEGEHIIPKTVDAAFDYTAIFFIRADNVDSANAKISAFNKMLYDQDEGSYIKAYKKVTFYNDYKRHKIVGYPSPIPMAKDFWRDRNDKALDVVTVEWKIRVTKPSLCDFDLE